MIRWKIFIYCTGWDAGRRGRLRRWLEAPAGRRVTHGDAGWRLRWDRRSRWCRLVAERCRRRVITGEDEDNKRLGSLEIKSNSNEASYPCFYASFLDLSPHIVLDLVVEVVVVVFVVQYRMLWDQADKVFSHFDPEISWTEGFFMETSRSVSTMFPPYECPAAVCIITTKREPVSCYRKVAGLSPLVCMWKSSLGKILNPKVTDESNRDLP